MMKDKSIQACNELEIHVGYIKSDGSRIKSIEGYRDSAEVIVKMFQAEKKHDIGYNEGAVVLDLCDCVYHDIIDTLTITKERYYEITGKTLEKVIQNEGG